MNVLLMTDKLTTGGAEYYFCKLENELDHPDCRFFYAASPGELNHKLKNPSKFTRLKKFNHLYNLFKIRRLVIKNKIDMIHANSLRMVLYAVLINKTMRRKIKIIYTKHNVTTLEKRGAYFFKNILNKHVEKVITVSEFEERNLIDLGIQPEKIRTIYNGVDVNQFRFHDKGTNVTKIGILARLSEEKNHQLFVEIANIFKDDRKFTFYIAGDGPEYARISSMISDLDLKDKVEMIGNVNNPEDFIKEMDVLLLTSHREVFPMVILEAMAVGTPIITIDRGGIKEAIIDQETGFLVSKHCVVEFSKKLLTLELNERLRRQMIKNARNKVEHEFSLKQMVNGTLEEYLKTSS